MSPSMPEQMTGMRAVGDHIVPAVYPHETAGRFLR